MKKLYTLIIATAAMSAVSQPLTFEMRDAQNANALVAHNQKFNKTTTAGGTDFKNEFVIRNISALTHTYIVQKFDDLIHEVSASDKAYAYFCVDLSCFPPTTYTAALVLAANETFSFLPGLDEASTVGHSIVKYNIFNQASSSDIHTTEYQFNEPLSVRSNKAFRNVSAVYPNPSNGPAFVDIEVAVSSGQGIIKVHNAMGACVAEKNVSLFPGKNTLSLDVENLEAGIYFLTIADDDNKITEKIILTK
jgi:hypothetical protein